jgi:hypothetical protein
MDIGLIINVQRKSETRCAGRGVRRPRGQSRPEADGQPPVTSSVARCSTDRNVIERRSKSTDEENFLA